MLVHIFEQSLAFFPFALGVFLSYGILKTADLTVDGSFVLGAGLFAKLVVAGVSPLLATVVAVAAGGVAGVGVSLLQRHGRITPLVAGILALFILQSFNLLAMGQPNIPLLHAPTLFGSGLSYFATAAAVLVGGGLLLLRTETGLCLRAFGSNPHLLAQLGRYPERYRMLGLSVSNALVAFSGTLTAQLTGYADIGMGTGLVLIGLAAVILGQQVARYLFPQEKGTVPRELVFCLLGVVAYFGAMSLLLAMGLNPVILKMGVGCALAGFLLLSHQRQTARGVA